MLPDYLPETPLRLSVGDDFSTSFTIMAGGSPADITGWEFHSQARPAYGSTTEMVITITAPTPTNGEIIVSCPHAQSDDKTPGMWVWDLVAIDAGGKQKRILRGPVVLAPCATDETEV
jgi:hypothetical protein